MVDVRPDPKPGSRSEGRTRPRRTFRKKATRKEWAAIRAEKLYGQPCRIASDKRAEVLHHLVPRSQGGDDVAANLVPLCNVCHIIIHDIRDPLQLGRLAAKLTDAEYAYCVSKLGEGAIERLFGVGAAR